MCAGALSLLQFEKVNVHDTANLRRMSTMLLEGKPESVTPA